MDGNLKLLIVENDKVVSNKLRQTLSDLFEEIYIAENGEAGFQSNRNNRPDLILSELNLPVINGMDMITKIRQINSRTRIILMSDSGDPQVFIRALEKGVKGILLKPLDYSHLFEMVSGEVKDIQLAEKAKSEEFRRLEIEKEYDKSKRILHAVSQATDLFFRSGFYDKTINQVIALIGEVTGASRVYIYKVYRQNKRDFASRVYEWTAKKIMPVIGNLSVTNVEISTSGFSRWVEVMKKHRGYVAGFVKDFDLVEQERLRDHSIKSIIAIPIFSKGDWWGFIGLDDCTHERIWSEPEISALEALANNLGGAIHKRDLDNQMSELNKSLEERVRTRTKELEFEIAERAMAEALLKDSEEKYRLIYENATYGILLIQNGRISLINPAMIDILEEKPRNLIGKKFADLVTRQSRKIVNKQLKGGKPDIAIDAFQVQVEIENKQTKWLQLKPTRIKWYGDPAFLVFVSNITLRKNAEDELQELNETLEKRVEEELNRVELQQQLLIQKSKLESLGELSAGLAHEINQPLLSLSMGLDNLLMMISQGEDDHAYQENKIKILFNDIDRIKQTIEHIRTFSRDQQNLEIDVVNVSQVIRDALSLVNMQMTKENVKIDVGCLEDDVFTIGNRFKLEQVVLNMISNARYAVDEKARRKSGKKYTKRITLSCRKTEFHALIIIYDNGIGIPEEILPDIFNPFFTTKSVEKGTGLGLSISYGIVKELKGEIYATSKENQYTQMIVELPLHSN